MQKKKSKLIRMSDIETEQVQWLWYPFILYGKSSQVKGVRVQCLTYFASLHPFRNVTMLAHFICCR